MVDPEKQAADMEASGVDLQVLSMNPPGVDRVTDPAEALSLSKAVDDDLSKIAGPHPGGFAALATVPMNDPVTA